MADTAAPPKTKATHIANQAFQYDEFDLEEGQLFTPPPAPNRDVLIDNGYLLSVKEMFPSGIGEAKCVRCGKVFADYGGFKLKHDSGPCAGEPPIDGAPLPKITDPEVAERVNQPGYDEATKQGTHLVP